LFLLFEKVSKRSQDLVLVEEVGSDTRSRAILELEVKPKREAKVLDLSGSPVECFLEIEKNKT
jgi:hypothetical protein